MMNATQGAPDNPRPASATHLVHLPKPTAWTFLMALGLTLLLGSVVMNMAVDALGLLRTIMGAVGWFRTVLPVQQVENFEVSTETVVVTPESHTRVRRIE